MKEIIDSINRASFVGVDYFYENKSKIKEEYSKFDDDTKKIYKWYFFYQFCLLKNPLKTLLWDYLNKNKDDKNFMIKLEEEYCVYCERRNSLHRL